MKYFQQKASLFTLLSVLTVLFIALQVALFIIHNHVNGLMDSLVQSAMLPQLFHPVILFPLLGFIIIQIISYLLLIAAIWFLTMAPADTWHLSSRQIYYFGLMNWLLVIVAITMANNFYFPDSFFAILIQHAVGFTPLINKILLIICATYIAIITLCAYFSFYKTKCYMGLASLFLLLGLSSFALYGYVRFFTTTAALALDKTKPNIILIGLDSLRPDFTHYFGNQTIHTPHIDAFLSTASTFTDTYTPLARTFPAWMSILTAKYPLHNHARTNLADSRLIESNDTLAKHLQQNGYETIYGTDEKRFSNILPEYGFNEILGPKMGVNDFLLGTLSDFPFTNLLINTPLGRILFPYNYANRAAAITYEPHSFLQLVKIALAAKPQKPLFLAIHLCISHWPFTWANDHQSANALLAERYQSSVEAVDKQFGALLTILKNNGLLENAIVVVLSDHGTSVGLPGDRLISQNKYLGNPEQLKWLPLFQMEHGALIKYHASLQKPHFDISYGQGTDVLSLKQHQVILALKGYGQSVPIQHLTTRASLLDIAPTILDLLHLPPMQTIDGISLQAALVHSQHHPTNRALFMETGYKVAAIEEAHINIAKVIDQAINIYDINPKNGLVYVDPRSEKATDREKQRAILMGNWLLARFPAAFRQKLVPNPQNPAQLQFQTVTTPPFFVLVNTQTGKWTIGLSGKLAQSAPLTQLKQSFDQFYEQDLKS